MLFKEYLDQINPELVDKYGEILKLAFGIYDDENAIAMMLAALAQGQKMQGGESEMEYDEENEQFIIKARAICFPMLVHEIVKGLYEIVGTEGFGADKAKNQAIVGAVDKLSNEPNDLRFGKFFYDAISKIYNDSDIEDARVRELFFAEVYKLDENDFFSFVENAINDELTPAQLSWATGTMKDIEKDLKKDDTGLEDLDEAKASGRQAVLDQLDFYTTKYYPKSTEGKIVNRIKKDIDNIQSDEELSQYLKDNFMNRSNSWGTRLIFAKLRDVFEGKTK